MLLLITIRFCDNMLLCFVKDVKATKQSTGYKIRKLHFGSWCCTSLDALMFWPITTVRAKMYNVYTYSTLYAPTRDEKVQDLRRGVRWEIVRKKCFFPLVCTHAPIYVLPLIRSSRMLRSYYRLRRRTTGMPRVQLFAPFGCKGIWRSLWTEYLWNFSAELKT